MSRAAFGDVAGDVCKAQAPSHLSWLGKGFESLPCASPRFLSLKLLFQWVAFVVGFSSQAVSWAGPKAKYLSKSTTSSTKIHSVAKSPKPLARFLISKLEIAIFSSAGKWED